MIIFLGGLAALLALAGLGGRAATHLWHHGGDGYFDRCEVCERRYPRLNGTPLTTCPQGHSVTPRPMTPDSNSHAGTVFIALCAGFAIVVLALTVTGVTHLP